MSEFFFGVGRGAVSTKRYKQIETVARTNGADFTRVTLPGEGPRFWFACPNRDHPFDKQIQQDVWEALRKEGLLDKNDRLVIS
jgi:hypothetical protein